MKIIISPAKVQSGKKRINTTMSQLPFEDKTQVLHGLLTDQSKDRIGQLMKIKGKLLDDTFDNIHNIKERKHAVAAYNGVVFKEINAHLYDPAQLHYLNDHLRILSAYYGILTPLTGVYPYRLDMTMKPAQINLYQFWSDVIQKAFENEDLIINLASVEFSSMIQKPLLNIHFKEEQSDGGLKVVTVRAKKARGLMVDYMAQHMIEDPQDLKKFSEMGYIFDPSQSDDWNYTFVLPYEG